MRSGLIALVVSALGVATLVLVFEVPLNDPLWWLTNNTPPRVAVDGPSGTVRGTIESRVTLEPAGRARVVSVRLDDQPRASGDSRIAVDTSTLKDGPHRLEVVAHDTSRHQNLGSAVWLFISDNTAPQIDVSIDPSEGPLEGHTLVLRVRPDEPVRDVRATVDGRSLPLQSDPTGTWWSVHGIPPDPPGTSVGVEVTATDLVGNARAVQREWPVHRTTFAEDDLELAPSQADLAAHAAEDARLAQIYRRPSGPKQWDGAFRAPVDGMVTTAFGTHRSYEYHPGTDFAAPQGAPVAAPASGVVAFIGSVPARGNIVILDHGAGVYSTYAHLEQAEVALGDQVKPGQVIARVGSTGFSTGPHLHWELWVDGANVDPQDWTRRAFP